MKKLFSVTILVIIFLCSAENTLSQKSIVPNRGFPAPLKETNKSTEIKEVEGQVVYYEEGFEDWDTDEPIILPDGWSDYRTASLHDSPVNSAGTNGWLANNPESDPFGDDKWEYYVNSGEGSIIIGYSSPEFTWAVTPEIALPDANGLILSYWPWYFHDYDENWLTNYHVKIFSDGNWSLLRSFTGGEDETNTFLNVVEIGLEEYKNKTIKLAFIYEYNDGYEMAIDDIKVIGEASDGGSSPVADFSASSTNISVGQTVYFTDLSVNSPTSFDWDFGDGGTSVLQNPAHTYNSAGNFTVSLTAGNSFGSDTETKTNYINVSEEQGSSDICEPYYKGLFSDHRGYITTDVQGNFILAGQYSGEANLNGIVLPQIEAFHFFLAKFDKNDGSVIWAKHDKSHKPLPYGSNYYLQTDSDNNLYLGISFKDSLIIDDVELFSELFCFAVFKFNHNGDVLWVKQSSSTTWGSYINDMAVKSDNELVIMVQYYQQMDFNGNNYAHSGYMREFVVIAINEDGQTVFNVNGSSHDHMTFGLHVDYKDYIFLYARKMPQGTYPSGISLPFDAESSFYLAIYDNTYNLADYSNLKIRDAHITDIRSNSSGDLFLNINHYTNAQIYGQAYNREAGFIVCLDNNGDFKNLIKIEGNEELYYQNPYANISVDKFDNIYWSCHQPIKWTYSYGSATVTNDNVIIKVNSDYQLEWMKTIDNDNVTQAFHFFSSISYNTNTIVFSDNYLTIPSINRNFHTGFRWAGNNLTEGYFLALLRADLNGNEVPFGYECTAETFNVAFEVEDEEENPVDDAIVTFDGVTNDAGHYTIEGVEPGSYSYRVEKEGYMTIEDETEIVDQDISIKIILPVITSSSSVVYDSNPIKVFPNPSSGVVHIIEEDIRQVSVLDLTGRIVLVKDCTGSECIIDLNNRQQGIYLIRVSTINGQFISKIVLE